MSIQYPLNTKSKYPEYMRKVAKLAHVLADDWINWKDGNDDHEWVPDLIQVDIGKHGEENKELYTLVMKANDYQVEIWFSGDVPVLDTEYLFEELEKFSDDEEEDLSETNLTGWITAVESLLQEVMSEDDIIGRVYENGELLDCECNEKISETYETMDWD